MRFQEALLLQKQQAKEAEKQHEAQQKLAHVATIVDSQYAQVRNFCDPLADSHSRIKKKRLEAKRNQSPTELAREIAAQQINHQDGLTPASLKIYRKLRFGQ